MKNDYFKTNYEIYEKLILKPNPVDIEDWAPGKLMSVYARYTQNSYFDKINEALRSGYSESLLVNDEIQALDELFSLVPNKLKNKTPMTVYRGALLTKELNDILQGKSETDIYTEKAFVSTSRSKQVARQFTMGDDKVIFEITLPANSTFIEDSMLPSHAQSKMKNEEEVLLPRNAQFKITEYNPKTKIVKATYLGQKLPLKMPEIFEYSGSDIIGNLNKNLLLIEKESKNNEDFYKKFNQ